MSALSPKADSCGAATDVGYGPIADIPASVDLRGKAAVSSINRRLGKRYGQ